jgi:hypothetical protein
MIEEKKGKQENERDKAKLTSKKRLDGCGQAEDGEGRFEWVFSDLLRHHVVHSS